MSSIGNFNVLHRKANIMAKIQTVIHHCNDNFPKQFVIFSMNLCIYDSGSVGSRLQLGSENVGRLVALRKTEGDVGRQESSQSAPVLVF